MKANKTGTKTKKLITDFVLTMEQQTWNTGEMTISYQICQETWKEETTCKT